MPRSKRRLAAGVTCAALAASATGQSTAIAKKGCNDMRRVLGLLVALLIVAFSPLFPAAFSRRLLAAQTPAAASFMDCRVSPTQQAAPVCT